MKIRSIIALFSFIILPISVVMALQSSVPKAPKIISKRSIDSVLPEEVQDEIQKEAEDEVQEEAEDLINNLEKIFTKKEIEKYISIFIDYGKDELPKKAISALSQLLENKAMMKKLSDYKVSGLSFGIDRNAGLIWDTQTPRFNVFYKDEQGDVKTRRFDCKIDSIGLKLTLSINLNCIFFTGNIDFENSNHVLELGQGIDLSAEIFPLIPLISLGFSFLYAPFTNAPGGILMFGMPILGFSDGISMVTGGTLTPGLN